MLEARLHCIVIPLGRHVIKKVLLSLSRVDPSLEKIFRYNFIPKSKYYQRWWRPVNTSLTDEENDCGLLTLNEAGNQSQLIFSAEPCSVERNVLCKQDSLVEDKFK